MTRQASYAPSLLVLSGCLMVATTGDGAATVIIAQRISGGGPADTTLLLACVFLPTLALVAAAGALIRRWGPRPVVAWGYLIEAALALALAATTGRTSTLLLVLGHGCLLGLTAPAVLTLFASLLNSRPHARRPPRPFAWYAVAGGLGQAGGAMLAAKFAGQHPVVLLLGEAGGCLIMTMGCSCSPALRAQAAPARDRPATQLMQVLSRINAAGLTPILILCAIGTASVTATSATVPLLVHANTNPAAFAAFQAFIAAGGLVGVLVSYVSRIAHARTAVLTAWLGAGAGIGVLALGSGWTVLCGAATLGLAGAAASITVNELVSVRMTATDLGTAFAASAAAAGGLTLVALVLLPAVTEHIGVTDTLGLFSAIVMTPGAAGLAWLVLHSRSGLGEHMRQRKQTLVPAD